MHQYFGINDPNRHAFTPLASSKIETRVRVVMTLPLGSFMDEDSPHPLKKNIVCDLVDFLLLVFFALFPFFCSGVGFARDWPHGALPSTPPRGRCC
jgi:hypothetical protein